HRLAAARALAQADDNGGLKVLMTETSVEVRQAAIFELARREDKAGLAALAKDLESPEYPTRHGAAWTLYRVGDKRGLIVLGRDALGGLQHYHPRASAIRYLNYIQEVVGDKRAVAKALIDSALEHIDRIDRGEEKISSETFEQFYFHGNLLKATTGQDFRQGAFWNTRTGRDGFRKNWQSWFKEHGHELPEVKPGSGR
ncbi:MAG: hypothetical protein AMS16_02315, partial [Planctomycetes bacterium DG_58]